MPPTPSYARQSVIGCAVLGSALALWPLVVTRADLYFQVLAWACLYGSLALSWNLFALTGALSLGHAAFFGLGAYGAALLDRHWQAPIVVTVILGALPGAFYGLLWSLVFRRLRGPYFALATLAAVEIPRVVIDNWQSVTEGSLGIIGIGDFPVLRLGGVAIDLGHDACAQYYLLLGVLLVFLEIHRRTLSSRRGWAIRAVRENECTAAMVGIGVNGVRLQALLLSSYLTAVCGALYAHLVGIIEPALVFNPHLSALPLVFTIFGGRYQYYGPVLGALLLYPVDQLLFHSWLPRGHLALYGLIIVVTIFFLPQGVGTWLQKRLGFASS